MSNRWFGLHERGKDAPGTYLSPCLQVRSLSLNVGWDPLKRIKGSCSTTGLAKSSTVCFLLNIALPFEMVLRHFHTDALRDRCTQEQLDLLNSIDTLRSQGISHYISGEKGSAARPFCRLAAREGEILCYLSPNSDPKKVDPAKAESRFYPSISLLRSSLGHYDRRYLGMLFTFLSASTPKRVPVKILGQKASCYW